VLLTVRTATVRVAVGLLRDRHRECGCEVHTAPVCAGAGPQRDRDRKCGCEVRTSTVRAVAGTARQSQRVCGCRYVSHRCARRSADSGTETEGGCELRTAAATAAATAARRRAGGARRRRRCARRPAQSGRPTSNAGSATPATTAMPSGAPASVPSCHSSFFLRDHGFLPQNVHPLGLQRKLILIRRKLI
jgi:hypothetical protein